jgi:hypothetical protein
LRNPVRASAGYNPARQWSYSTPGRGRIREACDQIRPAHALYLYHTALAEVRYQTGRFHH